jgi:hypothetical protein
MLMSPDYFPNFLSYKQNTERDGMFVNFALITGYAIMVLLCYDSNDYIKQMYMDKELYSHLSSSSYNQFQFDFSS